MMPKVSQGYMESQRLHILMAAFKCFGRKGFHETTMREICDEAEMSPGAVYNYFDGKEAIIKAIAEKSRESTSELFSCIDPSKSGLQNLLKILMKLSDVIEHPETSEGHFIRIRLWGEVLKNPELKELFKENYSELAAGLSDLIEQAKEEDDITADLDSSNLAHMIIALYQGMILQKAFNPGNNTKSVFELFTSLVGNVKT